MSDASTAGFELLFVRHGDARKRSETSYVRKLITRPFDDYGSTSFGSDGEDTFVLPTPQPQNCSLLIARFPAQNWFSVFSDAADVARILAANKSVGRLHFARLKYAANGTLELMEVTSGAKILGQLAIGTGPHGVIVSGERNAQASVAECKNAEAAIAAFREYFELGTDLKTVVEQENCYSVINENTEELNPAVCELSILEGRKSRKKGSVKPPTCHAAGNAKVNLGAALMRLDPAEVRLAIRQGQSPHEATGFRKSPLYHAMQHFESAGAPDCAAALIEAGAKIDNMIADICANIGMSPLSVNRVQFLIEHGGDVNAAYDEVTPIYCASQDGNVALVKLLMQHGADPTAILPHNKKSTIQFIEERMIGESSLDRQQVYAEILTELKGVDVAVPQAEPLNDALIAEQQRFAVALQAQASLASLPDKFRLQDSAENKLQNNAKFKKLHSELLAVGFQQNGLRFEVPVMPIFIVTYTNEQQKMDAVVSDRWWSKEVGCRVMSHGDDGRLYSVGNVSNPVDPNFDPEFLIRGEHIGRRPKKLVVELAKLVRQHKATLQPTPPDKFADRYQSGCDRILAETKRLMHEALNRNAICGSDGRPLRYERRQNYLNYSGFSDRDYSSRHDARHRLHDIATASRDNFHSCTSMIRDCFHLLAMQHLQYAGAPVDDSFIRTGADVSIQLFQKLRTTWKDKLAASLVTELSMSMLLCQMIDDESPLRSLCESVQPEMVVNQRNPEDPPLELDLAFLVIVSHFRTDAFLNLAEIRQQITSCRSRRAKALLNACNSLENVDGKSFQKSLKHAVKAFVSQKDPNPNPNLLHTKFAIPESILYNTARDSSLRIEFPAGVTDWMIGR